MSAALEDFLVRFGALAVFVGAAVEGDGTLLMAGVVAHMRLLALPVAIAAGALGGFVGDCLVYALGRRGGGAIRESAAYRRAAPVLERLVQRFGAWEIVLARFVYGARLASTVFWGIRGLSFARFAALDSVGCALWSAVLVSLGYLLSQSAARLLGDLRAVEEWMVAALVAAAAVAGGVRYARRRWWRAAAR